MSSYDGRWPPAWVDLHIVFDDDAMLAVDKPAGLACDPLRARVAAMVGDRVWLPQPIDQAISGLVVFAKNKDASRHLAAQLEQGPERVYTAVVDKRGARSWLREPSSKPSQVVRKKLARTLVGDGVPAHRVMLHLGEMRLVHPVSGDALELQSNTPVALERALQRDVTLPTDRAALEHRLRVAAELRHDLATDDTDAFRLANSGGDELPGVEVDRYGDFAVVALRSEEAAAARDAIVDAVAALGFAGVYLKVRRKHASVLVDTRSDDTAPAEPVRGRAAPSPLRIHENGLPLLAALGDGLSTGVFLDQRDGRRWVRDRAPTTMLNLFAYHGAFTIAAIAGGAEQTVTVDASGAALDGARHNLALVQASEEQHTLVKADAFRWLEGAAKRGRTFDVVVLDPPSFSTTKRTTFRADRHYRKLAALALRCVAPGGALLACTNHRGIVPPKFLRELERAAGDAGVGPTSMKFLIDPTDFPPEPGQAHHLKRVVVERLP